ncbi:MAG: hypothetical protein KZQ75_06285 [Candidatus Thiodiazotropha sp. (ex Myrtea spinifera)]|nr:hypothetical protein [Candidatus Thiodiazotropha sp. (ex Myrtea spinifera)]MCU7829845.1 hypothetical protein [Candidatus Thiodiazotropha sp. (ex Myrtea sp. 'scaly one' KF741663)]
MIDIVEYLNELGFTPIAILLLGIAIWFIAQYILRRNSMEKRKDEIFLQSKANRLQSTEGLADELHGLSNNFNHCIENLLMPKRKPLSDGYGSKDMYWSILNDHFVRIRDLARSKESLMKDDFPNFLTRMYSFTEHGLWAAQGKCTYENYRTERDNAYEILNQVRSNAPSRLRIRS